MYASPVGDGSAGPVAPLAPAVVDGVEVVVSSSSPQPGPEEGDGGEGGREPAHRANL